jgi:hypothetical protein
MKLTLLETSQIVRNGGMGNGMISGYDVIGLPAGHGATIAFLSDAWRFMRWNDQWHGNWTGRFDSAQAALDALREDFLATA